MRWDPDRYLAFSAPRREPAVDLLRRVPLEAPRLIYDLGCGPGSVTALLCERWPAARVIGIDNSPDMLAQAPARCPRAEWREGDIAAWRPDAPPDLIYSNAALQWLDDHRRLFPRLIAALAPGGVLAVQMPYNSDSPSQRLIAETVESGPWAARLRRRLRPWPMLSPPAYYDLLRASGAEPVIWQTEYLHVLDGDQPVLAWTKGTALRPVLEALDPEERAAFEADYARRLAAAYPPRADGRTLFPFNRLFIIATR